MMRKPFIILMVGLPGTGKSTYIKSMDIDDDVVVLSTDNIVEDMCRTNGITYDQGFLLFIEKATKLFNEQIANALSENKSIIIDRTNLTKKSRARILARVPNSYHRYAFYFPIPIQEEWDRRLSARIGKCIPQAVLDEMQLSFQMPTTEERLDAVFTIA